MRLAAILLAALATPALRAADGDSIQSAVRAVYDVISGPAGPRDWTRFRSLFAEGARLMPMSTAAGGTAPQVLTVEDYVKRTAPLLAKAAFYESETARRIETFGNIAHVFSTYESRHGRGEKPFARGINSFQLIKQGKTWKVMSVLWDTEREGNPIPRKYRVSPK